MAWNYYCEMDKQTITASTKTELVDKLIEHAKREHGMDMPRDQAEDSVERNARETAA